MANRREPSPAERAAFQIGFNRGYNGRPRKQVITNWEPYFIVEDDGEVTLVEETTFTQE